MRVGISKRRNGLIRSRQKRAFFWILVFLAACAWVRARENVTVEEAFWAYDDGRIGLDELEELLFYVENGDVHGACEEWEALGGDPCRKTLAEKMEDWKWRGNLSYGLSLDSTGSVRNSHSRIAIGLLRFSLEMRFKSESGGDVHLEQFRLLYKDRRSFSVFGHIVASDVRSAVPLESRVGNVWSVGTRDAEAGTILLTDTSAGIRAAVGRAERLQFLAMGLFSAQGFCDAFFRVKMDAADVQLSYSSGWRTPLLYASARTPRNAPLRFRFRAYFHQNPDWSGVFRIPQMVKKNRFFIYLAGEYPLASWALRFSEKTSAPLDSGFARNVFEVSARRSNKAAGLEAGMKWTVAGDSAVPVVFLRSGIRLFEAESLFCEWRETLKMPIRERRYEIRPGIRVDVGENVSAIARLIIRGPRSLPVVLREETQMQILPKFYVKSLMELRAMRLRQLHLWRLGVEAHWSF